MIDTDLKCTIKLTNENIKNAMTPVHQRGQCCNSRIISTVIIRDDEEERAFPARTYFTLLLQRKFGPASRRKRSLRGRVATKLRQVNDS